MKNLMVIFFLFILSFKLYALVPIEGIIFGEVKDVKQYDPFAGMLTSTYFSSHKNQKEVDKLIYYLALYKQGMGLAQKCESLTKAEYANFWKEDSAKRSLAATLQYIGLDLSIRSIVKYAKKFEMTEEEYENLYNNLVNNNCSKNISVYSHKFLKSNFKYLYQNDFAFDNPTIENSPYFNQSLKERHNTRKTMERELDYSLKNFRAFCSWNSDVHNFGLMEPYLKNPFIMSYVFNNLLKRTIGIDPKTEEIYLKPSQIGTQVSCENMICRRRSPDDFVRFFPRMNGSYDLEDDLNVLYCTHMKKMKPGDVTLSPQIKKWLDSQSSHQKSMETMHFISLITGYPDMTLMADTYQEVLGYLKENIQIRWDRWAEEKSNQFNLEQLYEEPLEISMESQINTNATELGNFKVKFKVELGEMDKLLNDHDKLTSKFNIKLPSKLISHLRQQIPYLYNTGNVKELAGIEKRFLDNINSQLEQKKKYFKVPIWNEQMSQIISDELLAQFSKVNLYRYNQKKEPFIEIPVEFHFGVFALQYIRKKYMNRFKKPLTAGFK